MAIKDIIKSLLPRRLLIAIRSSRFEKEAAKESGQPNKQIFTRIYEENAWGRSADQHQKFYSGSGSHEQQAVGAYLAAVRDFLASFERRPDVVDLGCGDFHVGANIREFCGNYVACDLVQSLIDFNKERFKQLKVDFRVLDLAEDELPKADVVFIRQVLQHLSNRHISAALPKIARSYKYLVLTEHLPVSTSFKANLDKPTGVDVRPAVDSGLVLTAAPFNLKVKNERVLCEVPEHGPYGGRIRTTLYELA